MIDWILWFLLGAGVLVLVVFFWVGIYFWLQPHVDNPNGRARITGSCGDTMEIGLKFRRDRVVESAHWTDGCVYSLNCICAAADFAKGKTPDEILDIDPDLIRDFGRGPPS